MEYLPCGSLSDQFPPLYTREIWSVLQQCLDALKHLHTSSPSILHRDIKPDNVLVQRRVGGTIRVKLADLGLAKRSGVFEGCVGTYRYMAPELVRNVKWQYNDAVDIWSLGLTIYSLLRPDLLRQPLQEPIMENLPRWHSTIVRDLHAQLKNSQDESRRASIDQRTQNNSKTARSWLLFILSTSMLVEDPASRTSAAQLLQQVHTIKRILYPIGGGVPPPPATPEAVFPELRTSQGTYVYQGGSFANVPSGGLSRPGPFASGSGDMPPPPLPSSNSSTPSSVQRRPWLRSDSQAHATNGSDPRN